jgi:protein TonB
MHATATSSPTFLHGLDGQRIAGTSLVIALHAAVALVLFMPVQQPAAPIEEVTTLIMAVPSRPIPLVKPIPNVKPVTKPVPATRSPPTTTTPPEDRVDPTPDGTLPPIPPGDATDQPPVLPSLTEIQVDVGPPPPYPAMALRRGLEGRVLLRVRVDEQGRPAEVTIEKSSGVRLLDEAALKFVQARWYFVPLKRDGLAIAADALVPIVFRIDR